MSLASRTPMTAEEYLACKARFSNWGRWGADDQLGTLNFITPEVRRAAVALAREGRSVSCAHPIQTRGVQPDERRNSNPADHRMRIGATGSSDYIGLSYHGYVNTHIDALCHFFTGSADDGGQLYNGRPLSVLTKDGARSNSVEHWRDGILTRGVLYDIPALRGEPHVTFERPVEGWELEAFAAAHGITPRVGDAVLIRSGSDAYWAANASTPMQFPPTCPGVAGSALEFLHAHDAALLSWDLMEAPDQGFADHNPIHSVAIPHMGLPLLDNANFERLSALCAELGRYEFLVSVAPLVVVGGTGSPVNPIATF